MAAIKLLVALAGAVALGIQAGSPRVPVPFGPTAGDLSEDHLRQIGRMAEAVGAKPWVVYAHGRSGFLPPSGLRPWSVILFGEPVRATAGLRRGIALALRAQLPPNGDLRAVQSWEQSFVTNYAQVPVPGSDPDRLTVRDVNRPFRINGTFSDSDIIQIVRLIRGDPSSTSSGEGVRVAGRAGDPPIERNWPIGLLTREPRATESTARVSLVGPTPDEDSGQWMSFKLAFGEWTVDRIGGWVSD
jgi:hypothetical protein